ncbi:hypothetical protein F5887DRAFT_1085118 [Amanita rubescens]|nr:hypothetical protein F5887DRAFT_1085118 [Amanita rubescens]
MPRTPKKSTTATVPYTTPSPSPKKSRSRKSQGTSIQVEPIPAPSVAQLLDQSRETTDEWYKSKRTKNGYANYVKHGKQWLGDWAIEDRTDSDDSELVTSEDRTGNDPEEGSTRVHLAQAFNTISDHTPVALRLLTAYKCEHQGCTFATAEGLRSAFKDYFERVLGCQGDVWRYNSHTKAWEGNPVFQSDFKTYYESLKNRDNRTGTVTQALPMFPKDLKVIMDYLDGKDGSDNVSVTRRLYFKAFATTAFALWTRNEELINLQFGNVKLCQQSATGRLYHEFQLVFRKTNKDPNKAQTYFIPQSTSEPEIDCYTHLLNWVSYQQGLIARSLGVGDLVFPAIASTGQIKFGVPTSRSGFETIMDDIVKKSGVMQGRNGKFTTHCFRRGGAQYRFMYAPKKWSLKAVKWWGGWSSGDNVNTIMRYLLEELTAYEEGFSDIMMDDRASERHESFMGVPDPSATPTKKDLFTFGEGIIQKFEGLFHVYASTPILPRHSPSPLGVTPVIATQQPPTPISTSCHVPGQSDDEGEVLATVLSAPVEHSPRPSRIPRTTSLDDVLAYWENGAPDKGLVVPLKQWADLFDPSDYQSEAVKLSNIRFIWEEFAIECQCDFNLFEAKFPGMRHQYTKLLKAVREARKERGEAKSRNRTSHKQ